MFTIFHVTFYQRENGKVPVKEFLDSLPTKVKAKAFSDIELLRKHGRDLKEPYVKPIRGDKNKGLYELRVKFSSDHARIFYFIYHEGEYVLLNGFVKKSMKTPRIEIEKARKFMQDYKRRCENENC